ncbi:MAG TPA: hypothetical protein VF894_11430 [Anaeromyxobacter sp.]
MLAALVTALSACASGAGPEAFADPSITLALVPASLEIAPGDTAQFTASVTGEVIDVTWAVEETEGGSVSDTGVYTASETEGTYHVVATSSADASKSTSAVVTVTSSPAPPPPSANLQGAGTTHKASFLTDVTGGGSMPSWTANVVTASCAGDGVADATACLQAAANAARDQGKSLVIPATSAFYKISGAITIYTSVGGVGGMPTITQTNQNATWGAQKMFILAPGMTGWIYNLHLIGTFNGSNAVTEHGHQIDVGNVNGVTIKGNLLENAMGDSVSTDISQWDGGSVSQNVIVDGNTMRNPYRCAVAFIHSQRNWIVMNNVIDKPVNFVSGVGIEPEGAGVVLHVEVAYNKFVMNNRTQNPARGADGQAVFGWHVPDPPTPTAGGDYYVHHNYGTFGTGFSGFGNGGWGYIYQASNVEGASVPK